MLKSRSLNHNKGKSYPIACVGASAGGLEALIAFFKFIPKNINMAFVLVQHMEPHHKSALSEILSRETSLDICEAKNNVKVVPAHVYVIPPNTLMVISSGRLRITTRTKRADGKYLPIDCFMSSLAQDQGTKAIGIILSGTGSDGTQGARAIKAKGGVVFAQNEKTAHYFGMPESVIESQSADFVLEPGEIARKLARLGMLGYGSLLRRADKRRGVQNDLNRILILLRDLTGVDFIHYKQTTILRRIERRMIFCHIKTHADYYKYLKAHSNEVDILGKEILIPVTFFFRDPEIFAVLRKKVFPVIVNKPSPQNPIRVWVPACSSGEEAYSFAILLYEYLEARKIKPYIQIFGTDLSEAIVEKARAGSYPEDIVQHVSSARLRQFFVKTETGYKIAKHIRDLCIFARQDITEDPPLSNMDIVSCRNLLIYLDAVLQNKALSTLHYALKPRGFLVLGTAESVTAVPDLFMAVDQKQKIYSKNIVSRKAISFAGESMAPFTASEPRGRNAVKNRPFKKVVALSKKPGIDTLPLSEAAVSGKASIINTEKDILKLKKGFVQTVERLNAISEEKDTFNEELKAANEEIQSSNEELQSMNEELETSKEELQATNEELITLNEELQNKNVELTHLNSDLSNVFSSTNLPIIIVGNDLRIKRFTPTARKVMNLIPGDIDRPIGDIKLNVDIDNLEETIRAVIDDMVMKEFEVKDKDGRWYSVRIRPYRTIDNKIDGAIIVTIDIDAIKRSMEQVQVAHDYTQAIIETMREPLVVLDKDVRVLSANKAFCDTFKVHASDVKSKLLYELGAHQWDIPQLRRLLGEILPKRNYFNDFEINFDFPNIGQRTMILNGRQIKFHGKDSPLILLVIEDITKRKKAEDVLMRDNKTLDKMVNKRSKVLLRLQLELAKSKHLSAIGTLAATVAHELRNPLAGIALSIYRIKKVIKDPVVEKMLAGISSRVLESDQIINNILMYSKTTAIHYEPVKINEILMNSVEEQSQKFPEAKISINERIDSTKSLTIDADSLRIKEAFGNILHNAFEAVHADTGFIDIETEINNSKVTIVIKDNGAGISKKDLKLVASPFFTTKAKGTGLGLAVCKQVVMLHSGSLTIKSVKGKGTSVVVTLPISRQSNG